MPFAHSHTINNRSYHFNSCGKNFAEHTVLIWMWQAKLKCRLADMCDLCAVCCIRLECMHSDHVSAGWCVCIESLGFIAYTNATRCRTIRPLAPLAPSVLQAKRAGTKTHTKAKPRKQPNAAFFTLEKPLIRIPQNGHICLDFYQFSSAHTRTHFPCTIDVGLHLF